MNTPKDDLEYKCKEKDNFDKIRLIWDGWTMLDKREEAIIKKVKLLNLGIQPIIENIEEEKPKKRGRGAEGKKVMCLNDGKIFNSAVEASKYYNISPVSISSVIKGRFKTTKNGLRFVFAY